MHSTHWLRFSLGLTALAQAGAAAPGPAIDATEYVAVAATGELIPDPTLPLTTTVENHGRTVTLPAGLVYVPAGRFTMGLGASLHSVYLDAYAIGKFEVTNAEWMEFVTETDREPPAHWRYGIPPIDKMNHPVLGVSWSDAQAYCDWRTQQTGWSFSLPTEAQWEKAARGPRANTYPWGDLADTTVTGGVLHTRFNYHAVAAATYLTRVPLLTYTVQTAITLNPATLSQIGDDRTVPTTQVLDLSMLGAVSNWNNETNEALADFVGSDEYAALLTKGGNSTPVGSYPGGVSSYGCHDMAGNAAEWVADWFTADYYALPDALENPRGPAASSTGGKIIRGGSWSASAARASSMHRTDTLSPDTTDFSVGFRLVCNFPSSDKNLSAAGENTIRFVATASATDVPTPTSGTLLPPRSSSSLHAQPGRPAGPVIVSETAAPPAVPANLIGGTLTPGLVLIGLFTAGWAIRRHLKSRLRTGSS